MLGAGEGLKNLNMVFLISLKIKKFDIQKERKSLH